MINLLVSILMNYVPVASPGQQIIDAIYSSDSVNVKLVVPVWVDNRKERLLISKNAFSDYLKRINSKYENSDSIKKEVNDILLGKKKLFFSATTAYLYGISEFRLLHWDNPYLLKQDTATKNRLLHEVLSDYSEAGSFFILNKEFENDDYIVEALFKYCFLVYDKNGRRLVIRPKGNSNPDKERVVANVDSMALMAKAIYGRFFLISHCYMIIPASIHRELVRLLITKDVYETYMRTISPVFTNRDSLQKELADVLTGRKRWMLDDSKGALDLIAHAVILRGNNKYLLNNRNPESLFKKVIFDYNNNDRSFAMEPEYLNDPEVLEILFQHFLIVMNVDGGVSVVRAKAIVK